MKILWPFERQRATARTRLPALAGAEKLTFIDRVMAPWRSSGVGL